MDVNANRRSFRDLHGRSTPRPLHELLPQPIPYSVNIDPTNLCDFRCSFCPTGNPEALKSVSRHMGMMKIEVFQKIVEDLREMTRLHGRKIHRVLLHKDGEPLLHKQLPEMVHLAKDADIADSVEVTTNGSRLKLPMIRGLLEACLDVLRVSVEHLNNDVYHDLSYGRIKYEDVRENVRTLFLEKQVMGNRLHVQSKIVDTGLSEAEKIRFAEDFARYPTHGTSTIFTVGPSHKFRTSSWEWRPGHRATALHQGQAGLCALSPLQNSPLILTAPFRYVAPTGAMGRSLATFRMKVLARYGMGRNSRNFVFGTSWGSVEPYPFAHPATTSKVFLHSPTLILTGRNFSRSFNPEFRLADGGGTSRRAQIRLRISHGGRNCNIVD